MAVPIFEDFFYPFLLSVEKKEMTLKEIRNEIIDHFHLTDEDCAQKTRSGTSTQLKDRLNWTRQYLRRALFIEMPSKGVYRITERGRDYLSNHSDLRKDDLLDYPEFAAFALGNQSVCYKSV